MKSPRNWLLAMMVAALSVFGVACTAEGEIGEGGIEGEVQGEEGGGEGEGGD